jgi:RNA polymerase sigma-70 factor (ECF subfamily)
LSKVRRPLEPWHPGHTDPARLALVPPDAREADVVYERVAPTVHRIVWLYLATDPERDDVAQDIFVSIIRRAGSIRDPARLEAWAARVAFNAIFNLFRRRKFRRWLSLDLLAEHEHPARRTDFEGRELAARAQQILESLPVLERMAFTLELFGNASQEEMARLCDCSKRTLRRRLKSARERFLDLARHDAVLSNRLTEIGGSRVEPAPAGGSSRKEGRDA